MTTCPPTSALTFPAGISRQLWESGFEIWRAAVDGASHYWLGALERGASQ